DDEAIDRQDRLRLQQPANDASLRHRGVRSILRRLPRQRNADLRTASAAVQAVEEGAGVAPGARGGCRQAQEPAGPAENSGGCAPPSLLLNENPPIHANCAVPKPSRRKPEGARMAP